MTHGVIEMPNQPVPAADIAAELAALTGGQAMCEACALRKIREEEYEEAITFCKC